MAAEARDIAGADVFGINGAALHALEYYERGSRTFHDLIERRHANRGIEFVEKHRHLQGKIRRADHLHDGGLKFLRLTRILQDS